MEQGDGGVGKARAGSGSGGSPARFLVREIAVSGAGEAVPGCWKGSGKAERCRNAREGAAGTSRVSRARFLGDRGDFGSGEGGAGTRGEPSSFRDGGNPVSGCRESCAVVSGEPSPGLGVRKFRGASKAVLGPL